MNPSQAPSAAITRLASSVAGNRRLIWQIARREIAGRYRGSMVGLAWSFFNPLLLLGVYTFVFAVVFKSRWGVGAEETRADFAIILFVGLIVHGMFAECINRAPSLVLSNANYVKRVVFPLEVLPWVAMASTLFHTAISVLVLLLVQLVLRHSLPWTAALFPFVLLPLVLTTVGLAYLLSAVGVYLRDIGQMTVMFTTVLFFISPVVYPMAGVPPEFQFWMRLSPLTMVIEQGRNCLIYGIPPDGFEWGRSLLVGLALAWLGFACFQKMRRGFADVI